jgi:hypothetical protein
MTLIDSAQKQAQNATLLIINQVLHQYAVDTWQSFVALTNPGGLPADNISASGQRAQYTSPTNIAAYLWSTLAAGDLHIIPPGEVYQRIEETLQTLTRLERHQASGMYYNWYNPQTGEMLRAWPAGGGKVNPFLSSVDNGWLAAALILISNSLPPLCELAQGILNQMDFAFFLNPKSGLLYGGCWPMHSTKRSRNGGYTRFDFGTLNTEPRIASYIGIAMGSLPPEHYFRMWRTFPPSESWDWQKMRPQGTTRTYMGIEVFEGHYRYQGMGIVPTWEGSMFEALMPPLFVPETQWGPRNWGINHPLYVQSQISYGLEEAQLGYWGFSPAADPYGGYEVYGVEAIGMNADHRKSKRSGVITPHAVFLGMPYAIHEACQNLEKLRQNFPIYGQWGFWDSVDVKTGQVASCVLALDQGMIMAALSNVLLINRMQQTFSQGMIEQAIRPLLEMEEFSAGLLTPANEDRV